ncbi:hypothetical protein EUX98_g2080 [Antrodiella citrinella]|uniref:Ribosome biogenesis protein NSA1 n=1 Tax=Antrodiella citrinella TaxID=2447956 RepID=A0A4S4MZX4_9APHY|nr:hypothetical protein EUX98_g2080 [Antrodiella citrinella]
MAAFYISDELGAIKHITYTQTSERWTPLNTTLFAGSSEGKGKAFQKLAAFTQVDSQTLLAAARADGTAVVLAVSEDGETAETVSEWKETRLKDGQRYVGLSATTGGIYSCTSNGALRLTQPNGDDTPAFQLAALPMRLTEWRLSQNVETFTYAGDEVEVSVWNTERAFAEASTSRKPVPTSEDATKKRKRSEQLLPGEIWRAKNLPNDELNLRHPVRNTALTYLQPSANTSQQHLLVGTQFGDVRRYDTRAARRPVANWKVGKVGGIGVVEIGTHEHEAFAADQGTNLYAIDLRNGQVTYGYKSIAGAVTSVASSGTYLASTAQDRYLRLHSTFPPPSEIGQQQDNKGEVLDKLYVKSVPTCIVADPSSPRSMEEDEEEEDEAVWAGMEDANSDDEGGRKRQKT